VPGRGSAYVTAETGRRTTLRAAAPPLKPCDCCGKVFSSLLKCTGCRCALRLGIRVVSRRAAAGTWATEQRHGRMGPAVVPARGFINMLHPTMRPPRSRAAGRPPSGPPSTAARCGLGGRGVPHSRMAPFKQRQKRHLHSQTCSRLYERRRARRRRGRGTRRSAGQRRRPRRRAAAAPRARAAAAAAAAAAVAAAAAAEACSLKATLFCSTWVASTPGHTLLLLRCGLLVVDRPSRLGLDVS
jgi:hypothetical protein